MRPGVATTFWNPPAALELFGILLVYFGEALLVYDLTGTDGMDDSRKACK